MASPRPAACCASGAPASPRLPHRSAARAPISRRNKHRHAPQHICVYVRVCVCPCGWGGGGWGVRCVPGACVLARARVFLCGWIGDFNGFSNNPCPPLGMVSASTTAHRWGGLLVFSPAVLARGFRPSLPAPPPFPVTSSALTAASHLLDSEPKLSCLTGPFLTARM